MKYILSLFLLLSAFVAESAMRSEQRPLPPMSGNAGKFLQTDGVNALWAAGGGGGGSGTVTNVGLTMPSIFSVVNSPVTVAGTFGVTLANQVANSIWVGPASGPSAAPTFRALVPDDIPIQDASKISGGTLNVARIFLPSIGAGDIEIGTADGFGRNQIWNRMPNASMRLGALDEDGDTSTSSSEGIVVYGANAQGDPMVGSGTGNFGYARIKPMRFGLYNSKNDSAGYIFKVDPTSLYLADNSYVTKFSVDRVTGNVSVPTGTIASANYALTNSQNSVIHYRPLEQTLTHATTSPASIPTMSWTAGSFGAIHIRYTLTKKTDGITQDGEFVIIEQQTSPYTPYGGESPMAVKDPAFPVVIFSTIIVGGNVVLQYTTDSPTDDILMQFADIEIRPLHAGSL
jgi:hypothetical protein